MNTVKNNSYGLNWYEATFICVDIMNSKRQNIYLRGTN